MPWPMADLCNKANEIANLVRNICPVAPRNLVTVPNGVNSTYFVSNLSSASRKKRTVLVLSRLDADRFHAIEQLMRAIAPWSAWQLSVAGDGNCKQALQDLASELGMKDRTAFLGHVYDPSELLRRHSFVAANGRALLEGAASGCRCILLSKFSSLHIVTSADMPVLASNNYSGRGFFSSARSEELVPTLEACLNFDATELSSWVKKNASQAQFLSAWGFPKIQFSPINGLLDVYNAIIRAQGAERVAFIVHPGVLRAIYSVWPASALEYDFEKNYIAFLENRNNMLNQLLWRARQALARANQAI